MKTTYDKITTILLVIAFFFAGLATLDKTSSASTDPWCLPVIAAVIFSLNWDQWHQSS